MNKSFNENPSKDYVVYILRCADNSLYCGITNDLKKRIKNHNAGKASKCTRARLPVELVYFEEGFDKSSALKREIEIKKLSHDKKLNLIKENRAI